MKYYTTNVFSEKGISGGNQLGVVIDDQGLSIQEMQNIAKQFNYSESTFVSNITDESADVRIFLPIREILFAGHPLVGTAFVLETIWRRENSPREKIKLNLINTSIEIKFHDKDNGELIFCEMDQLIPIFHGQYDNYEKIASWLGISRDDIMDLPMYLISPSDLPFLFVPVKSIKVLNTVKPNHQALIDNFEEIGGEPFVFSMNGVDGGDVHARFYAPKSGIMEDPATGSAQVSLGLALFKNKLLPIGSDCMSFVTEQGYEMGRPCKLYNNLIFDGDKLVSATTSGYSYLVSEGNLFL
jgi:trans-2,3-dihydro-3-hydroxyanthranilate isomerase